MFGNSQSNSYMSCLLLIIMLRWEENLRKYPNVSKYYDHDCRSFSWSIIFKKYSYSIKRVVNLAKIESITEASHHLTLMDNCQHFSHMVLSLCCCCGIILQWERSVLLPSLMVLQFLWQEGIASKSMVGEGSE